MGLAASVRPMALTLLRAAPLAMAAGWFGAMAFSLLVIQPKAARFFLDASARELFLTALPRTTAGNCCRWPARVFAFPAELPGYQRRLRIQAPAMTALVAAAFLTVAAVSG